MKIDPSRHSTEGSILLVTVITLIVLTIMAVSYLFMLKDDNYFVARDQSWNRALVIAEAGVEEAMAHINSGGIISAPLPNFSGDTWSASGTNYAMTRSTNLYGGGYSVLVGGPPNTATITSTGMVTAPLSGTTLHRTVQVTATFTSGFQVGIASITTITGKGNNIAVDSYDSSDTNKFPGGRYNAANREDHGDIAVLTNSGSALSLGNANIMGVVHTAPGGTEGQVGLGPNGAVGDVPWANPQNGTGTGFESSAYFAADFNLTFPDIKAPYSSGGTLPNATNAINTGEYYVNGTLTQSIIVGPLQYVVIFATGSFNPGTVTIQQGGTLVIFAGQTAGSSASFGTINNTFGNAANFQFYGLPGLTSISMAGNDAYVGTVYAPEASIKLSGGGNDTMDYQGAMVIQQLTVNGHFNMHYDENLAREPVAGDYVATSWTELTH